MSAPEDEITITPQGREVARYASVEEYHNAIANHQSAIDAAVAAERERCAVLLESLPPASFYPGAASHIAAAIRAGGEG